LSTRLQFEGPGPTPKSDDIDLYTKWKDGPEDLDIDAVVKRWRGRER